jgi:lipopolysaccharide transport system permease protein
MSQMSLTASDARLAKPPLPPGGAADLDPAPAGASTEIVIQPKKGWIGVDWGELVSHRELLYFLIWRDLKVKYKQAVLGAAWAIFVPVLSMVIYTVIGNFAGFNKAVGGAPYAVYIYAGLIPWIFLATAIQNGGMALINQQALMSKIYMPRLFIPMATVGSALVDMLLSGVVFALVCVYYGFSAGFVPSWQIVFLPLLILLQVIAGLGIAFLLSAATVMYRDLRFLIPFLIQVGVWLSAVVFPPTIMGKHANLLAINPLAGIISGWRACILGTEWYPLQILSSTVMCTALLVLGLFYFKRVERRFADIA